MKCKFFIFLYFFVSVSVYSLDMSFEYYLPCILGMVSGETKMFSVLKIMILIPASLYR